MKTEDLYLFRSLYETKDKTTCFGYKKHPESDTYTAPESQPAGMIQIYMCQTNILNKMKCY